jgi:hypothetical protein
VWLLPLQRAWRRFINNIETEVDQQLMQEEEEDARAEVSSLNG